MDVLWDELKNENIYKPYFPNIFLLSDYVPPRDYLLRVIIIRFLSI